MGRTISKKRIVLFALVIAYMAIIFAFSAQTATESSQLSQGIAEPICRLIYTDFDDMTEQDRLQLVSRVSGTLRVMGHGGEFAGLAALFFWLLGTYRRVGIIPVHKGTQWALSTLISMGYAVTDEIHQLFVPGRACELFDLCVDTIGAAIGGAIILVFDVTIARWRSR